MKLLHWDIGLLLAGGFDNGVGDYGGAIDGDISWRDESYEILHYGPGWVSMANVGKESERFTNCCVL